MIDVVKYCTQGLLARFGQLITEYNRWGRRFILGNIETFNISFGCKTGHKNAV